jgi:hypothetical protein
MRRRQATDVRVSGLCILASNSNLSGSIDEKCLFLRGECPSDQSSAGQHEGMVKSQCDMGLAWMSRHWHASIYPK